jgi:hypothetical protein
LFVCLFFLNKKVETRKPMTPQQQQQQQQHASSVSTKQSTQPSSRVLSPLVTAGTTTTTTTTTANSRPTMGSDDAAAVAAQARLAAAAALVSKSVRKSADFNPNGGSAGSRGSLVGDYYPGATTGFTTNSSSTVAAAVVHSKRSSYAGTPTCKSEFIYSINAPASFTSPPAGSTGYHARYPVEQSSLPHHFHYPGN